MKHAQKAIVLFSRIHVIFLLSGLLFCTGCSSKDNTRKDESAAVKPYDKNPSYWQYKGKPVLLIGGTDNDNLFQMNHLKTHLDSLKAVGGNYIRNTMSDRDSGNVRAFHRNEAGKYDLNKWNEVYWKRFENLLMLTSARDIIVQIEIWDRFDHSRKEWLTDPYNPKNNINYTYEQAGLDSLYPKHPGQNAQPFFFSVPALENNEILLKYQKAFVEKLLSISLQYGNVLFCMDNETQAAEEWGTFWAGFVRSEAGKKRVMVTEMWDDWNVTSETHKRTIDHPERYDFIDISQNSQTLGYANWEHAQYVFDYIRDDPRPVNSTKIYGSDYERSAKWAQKKDSKHAIHTFFRNLVGGFASSRFHRPPYGLGLSEKSINCMKTIRKTEALVKYWEILPRMDLLSDNEEDEAYIAAKEKQYYLIYFTGKGDVKLDLSKLSGKFMARWIDIEHAEWTRQKAITGGDFVDINSDYVNGCLVVVMKK